MCSWGRLQIHHDPCHDKALTVDLFWMFQKQLSWIRFLNWLSSTKNESLPYRVHQLPFLVNFIHTTLHILRIVSMVTWRTREVLKIYLHCNISISRLFITGKLSLTRNNAFPILKIKVWGEWQCLLSDSKVFCILVVSNGSHNVLSFAFQLIFLRHRIILLPEFSLDTDWVEAACIRPCSIQNPLGMSLHWGSSQFTRGFGQNHSNKVCGISFNRCE